MRLSNRFLYLLACLAALLSMALVFYATRYGPGVGGDATIYLTSAKNLVAGNGLGWNEADGTFRLLPYTPPFYPLVLGFVDLLGEIISGARLLNILLSGASVLLMAWACQRFCGQPWLAVVVSGLLAASPVLLGVQVWAMSEVLFIFLGFSGLVLLLLYFEKPRRLILVISALLLGLAFLTRYIGLAFVATGGLALLLLGRGEDARIRVRLSLQALREASLFGLVAVLPTLAWMAVAIALTGTVGSRSAQPASAYWQRFLEIGPALQKIYLFWLVPDSVTGRLPAALQAAAWLAPLILLAGLVWLVARRVRGRAEKPMVQSSFVRFLALFGLFMIVYLLVLAVVQVFTFPPITLASRMLSPVHFAALLLAPGLLSLGQGVLAPGRRLIPVVLVLAGLAMAGTYALRSALIARDYHQAGIGYNSLSWQSSATIDALRSMPADIPLISNEVTAIMYLAGRPAYALQEIYQSQPQHEPFAVYGSGEDLAQTVFREQGGALVLFSANLQEDFSMYGDRVDERLQALTGGLYPFYTGEDGAVYFLDQPEFDLRDQ